MNGASVAEVDRPGVRWHALSRSLRGGLKGAEYTWALAVFLALRCGGASAAPAPAAATAGAAGTRAATAAAATTSTSAGLCLTESYCRDTRQPVHECVRVYP